MRKTIMRGWVAIGVAVAVLRLPAALAGTLRLCWAQTDLTPNRPVLIAGQFHARVSEGVMDPVTATILALESVRGGYGAVPASTEVGPGRGGKPV